MVTFAESCGPTTRALFPRKRKSSTTEGGLDVVAHERKLPRRSTTSEPGHSGELVHRSGRMANRGTIETGVEADEIHTGRTATLRFRRRNRSFDLLLRRGDGSRVEPGSSWRSWARLRQCPPDRAIPEMIELNIGHSIMARAVIVGIAPAVREIKSSSCGHGTTNHVQKFKVSDVSGIPCIASKLLHV